MEKQLISNMNNHMFSLSKYSSSTEVKSMVTFYESKRKRFKEIIHIIWQRRYEHGVVTVKSPGNTGRFFCHFKTYCGNQKSVFMDFLLLNTQKHTSVKSSALLYLFQPYYIYLTEQLILFIYLFFVMDLKEVFLQNIRKM